MNDSNKKVIAEILSLIEQENAKIKQYRLEQYDDFDDEEKAEESFETFCNRFTIKTGPVASLAEIEELENLVACTFPEPLKEFYLNIGGIGGQPLSMAYGFSIEPVQESLRCLKDELRFYDKLLGFGLIQMVRYAWGDSHDILKVEDGEISEAEVSRLNRAYTSFGFVTDGHAESHGYFYFDKNESFGYAYYHQDEFPPSDPNHKANHTLFELLKLVITIILKDEDDDEDDLYDSEQIEDLIYN